MLGGRRTQDGSGCAIFPTLLRGFPHPRTLLAPAMVFDPLVRALIPPVTCWLFFSGLDDLFIDLWFVYLKTFGHDSWSLVPQRLNRTPEKKIALFVPCWQEDEVIEGMID